MNISLFKKAIYYYNSGMVSLDEETRDKLFFEVDGETIEFSYGKGFLETLCTCKMCSIKDKYNSLCARKLACLFYLEHQYFKKLKEE